MNNYLEGLRAELKRIDTRKRVVMDKRTVTEQTREDHETEWRRADRALCDTYREWDSLETQREAVINLIATGSERKRATRGEAK